MWWFLLGVGVGVGVAPVWRGLCALADAIDAPHRRARERDTARRAAGGPVDRGVLLTAILIVVALVIAVGLGVAVVLDGI